MSETPSRNYRIDDELRSHFQRAFGFDEPPETYGEFWRRMLETYSTALDRDLTLDDLCTTDESPHWARVDGETQHYQCVTDAFVVGFTLDEPVTARTLSPVHGTEIVVEIDGEGSVSAPEGAVLSFGVERSVEPTDGPVTPRKMYGRFCPYSLAFDSREEYETWQEDNPDVVSQAQPLDEALELQARLVADVTGSGSGNGEVPDTDDVCSC